MSRPAPYPADTNAKGWRLEVDYEALERSPAFVLAPPEHKPWLAWERIVAWKQVPCGSFEDADDLIAARIGMPADQFAKLRPVLLRDWWKADDGRLYCDDLVQRVQEMLVKRQKDAKRTADSRARRADSLAAHTDVTRDTQVIHSEATGEFDTSTSTSTRTSTGEKKDSLTPRKKRGSAASQLVSLEVLVADGVDEQHATDWFRIRKEKRMPLTPTAWADTKEQAAQAGMSIGQAVHHAVVNGWGGFKKKWVDESARLGRQPTTGRTMSDAAREAANASATQEALQRLRNERAGGDVIDAEVRVVLDAAGELTQ